MESHCPEGKLELVTTVEAIAGLLLVAAGVRALVRRVPGVPFPIALVVAGMGLQALAGMDVPFLSIVGGIRIPPEVAFFVFLPVLVFESAFNMEVRDLRENLAPVLTLAIPGLVASTVITGWLLHLVAPLLGFPLDWPSALLLGAILSATDPVGVSTLFKQIGAPRRLSVLVEGESLFNDATAIVTSNLLQGILLGGAGISVLAFAEGAERFLFIFAGGVAVGWGAAVLVGMILGRVEADAFIEISLTLVLAYLAFILAEETLGVSGVMATLISGILMGGWGKTKISPAISGQLEQYWAYLAGVANALVFLMVGLRVELGALSGILPMAGIAVGAMLLARALSVGLLMPLQARVRGGEPVARRYQLVMVWGGLRGGIALAIALSLPPGIPYRDELFIPLAMAAVLFTLLVQGLTIRPLVRKLGLDVPSLPDRVARVEGLVAAKRKTLSQVPSLVSGGLFSPHIAQTVQEQCGDELDHLRGELAELRRAQRLDLEAERRLLHLRVFAEERSLYYDMFSRGHLSEGAYRNLVHSLSLQSEAIRHEGQIPDYTLHPPEGERRETVLYRILDAVPGLHALVERLRAQRTVRDYEVTWARSRGSQHVLKELEGTSTAKATLPEVVAEVEALYRYWQESARARLDQFAEQFPEFVTGAQVRLASRIVVHAEREAIQEKARSGIIPEGVAHHMLESMDAELRRLKDLPPQKLAAEPRELLRKVPFFRDLPEEEAGHVVSKLRRRTAPSGELIVRQGGPGDSMYLLVRGVVRVSRSDGGFSRDLATLMAGDFFGEMALVDGGSRTATCRAVTPCALYELRRADLEEVLSLCPSMREALRNAARARREEQRNVRGIPHGDLEEEEDASPGASSPPEGAPPDPP